MKCPDCGKEMQPLIGNIAEFCIYCHRDDTTRPIVDPDDKSR